MKSRRATSALRTSKERVTAIEVAVKNKTSMAREGGSGGNPGRGDPEERQ
ncbi:hypothetical protein KAJ77_11785 [bacterium]|nr:hypothetical protein [bacterium]